MCENTAVSDDDKGPAGGLFPYTMYTFILSLRLDMHRIQVWQYFLGMDRMFWS